MSIKKLKQSSINNSAVYRNLAGESLPLPAISSPGTYSGGYFYHKFIGSQTVTVLRPINYEVILVAGGGGSGGTACSSSISNWSGGGGAGDLIFSSGSVSPGDYALVIGAGGAHGTNAVNGSNGNDTTFLGLTSGGGGGGGRSSAANATFGNGGASAGGGGGGGFGGLSGSGAGGTGDTNSNGFGQNGGKASGNGGGLGTGNNGTLAYQSWMVATASGLDGGYIGAGSAGLGGGGFQLQRQNVSTIAPNSGAINTGSGGGRVLVSTGSSANTWGAPGGSGLIILRYLA